MAIKAAHKKLHKFEQKRAVRKEPKTTKKILVRHQPKKEQEFQKSIISEAPVAQSGLTDAVPIQQPQQAQVSSTVKPLETQPVVAASPFLENPKPSADSKENVPSQTMSKESTSDVSGAVSGQKPVETSSVQASEVGSLAPSAGSDTTPPLQNSGPEHKKGKLWIILAFIIFLALVGGGLYYFRQEVLLKSGEKKEEPIPTPLQASPSPKPEEATASADLEADPSEFSIKVLNGSGTAGEAAKVRDILEEADFIVEDIGNADASTYEKTIIKAKKHVSKEYLDLLREEIGKLYLLDENETLEESEDTDVVVIIGREEV